MSRIINLEPVASTVDVLEVMSLFWSAISLLVLLQSVVRWVCFSDRNKSVSFTAIKYKAADKKHRLIVHMLLYYSQLKDGRMCLSMCDVYQVSHCSFREQLSVLGIAKANSDCRSRSLCNNDLLHVCLVSRTCTFRAEYRVYGMSLKSVSSLRDVRSQWILRQYCLPAYENWLSIFIGNLQA